MSDIQHPLDRTVRSSLAGQWPPLFIMLALLLGTIALWLTPREEEPQIVVPVVDIEVAAPGLTPQQVERQVTDRLEKLLSQIPGVEHIYSRSDTGSSIVTLRFYVGEDREKALLNSYIKLYSNQDQIPGVVSNWAVKPVEVDDVPILMLGLWSEDPTLYSDYELRRFAEEITSRLQTVENSSEITITGGRSRTLQLQLHPQAMAARHTTALDILQALQRSNRLLPAGEIALGNQSFQLQAGDVLRDPAELNELTVNVVDGRTVQLRDVATLRDGPADPDHYQWLSFSEQHPTHTGRDHPLVTIAVAKQRGSNAVWVAEDIHREMAQLKAELLPPEIHIETLRDYGETANDKVNNLTSSLLFAVVTVVIFIGIFLGWRAALVVALAIPVVYGATLALDLLFGYTINRVTLFALILALGLLVDDPITGVDNIERLLRNGEGSRLERVVAAMAEIRGALVMSTITILLAFIPLAFITGMMGPYMAPMAFNVPVSVTLSTLVAFMITPWMAGRLLTQGSDQNSQPMMAGSYRRVLEPVLANRKRAWQLIGVMVLLFVAACMLPVLRQVPLKLLPFDNKNELQILIDMPEGTPLEQTAAVSRQAAQLATQLPEVTAVASYVGRPSPVDFNGMIRQYDRRIAPHLSDLRLTLAPKAERSHQSHAVLLRLRQHLQSLNGLYGANIKVVEVPPGPPVISTLVAELYGETLTPYQTLRDAAKQVEERFRAEPFVVDVDTMVGDEAERLRFVTDKSKAALSGIATSDIAATLALANNSQVAGYLHQPREASPLPIELKLPLALRGDTTALNALTVKGQPGIVQQQQASGLEAAPQPLTAIGELGAFVRQPVEQPIYHKDLRPVVYVTAELEGRTPAEVIADISSDFNLSEDQPRSLDGRHFLNSGSGIGWSLPEGVTLEWGGEGEWRITIRVFRDLGLAFGFALIGIFVVLRIQTGSNALSGIIMSAIPLTVIGILPGFWIINQFGERTVAGAPDPILFTATAMIGMIALAGIVVRNSLILVEFIRYAEQNGQPLKEALIEAGSVRMRPVLLTAGTTLLGNLVIVLDPVFSGLALAIIFGIIASTLFTLLVVPTVYYLVYDRSHINSATTQEIAQ